MNLTFHPSYKEKENSNIFSNYFNHNKNMRTKSILFPSIFSHFETETNQTEEISPKNEIKIIKLPFYKNIKKELLLKKKQINSLYDINNSIFKQMRTRYNSICYKNFVKGFGKYFFGPFGLVTKRNKHLKEYYLHKSLLNSKIYAGKLEYFDYTSHNTNQVIARENETKKRRLSLSQNLAVVFDKNDMYSVKALTSKRLLNYKKNFVDINRSRYLNSDLHPIKEIPKIISNKNSKNKMKQKKKMQIRLNTYNNFNKNKNEKIIKSKNFSFITETKKNSNNNNIYKNKILKIPKDFVINFKSNKVSKINKKSNLFLTQSTFNSKYND